MWGSLEINLLSFLSFFSYFAKSENPIFMDKKCDPYDTLNKYNLCYTINLYIKEYRINIK